VVGLEDRRATPEEIEEMRRLIAQGMADGALGVSSGLYYAPAIFSSTEEGMAVSAAARPWRAMYSTHMRNENVGILAAITETMEIGVGAGLTPDITHMKILSPSLAGKSADAVGIIKQANAKGIYTTASVYPYTRSSTSLTAVVPPWVQDGGRSAMLERFANPALRERIAEEIERFIEIRVGTPEGIYFPPAAGDPRRRDGGHGRRPTWGSGHAYP